MDKPVKMVVCDLDGTLLYNTKKITERTKKAIRAIRRQGILFGVCSGRSAVALQTMLKVWGIDKDVDFVLGFNGGMFWDPKTGKTEEWLKLDQNTIPFMEQSFPKGKFTFAEYKGKAIRATRKNPVTAQMGRRNRLNFEKVKPEDLHEDTLKYMAVGRPWRVSRYLKENQGKPRHWRMFRSGPFLIEMVHPSLSTLAGIEKVAAGLGISNDEILTFGNDNNDREMLEGCVGVAMGNALEDIKKAARYVTDTNRNDGVDKFLEEHVIGKQNA